MVINDLDIPTISVAPYEADSPLIVDANAVLSPSVTAKRFQAISGRYAQIGKLLSRIDYEKLFASSSLNLWRETTDGETCEDRSRTSVAKAPDHEEA